MNIRSHFFKRAAKVAFQRRAARFVLAAAVVGMLAGAGYAPKPLPVTTLADITVMRDYRTLSDMDQALYAAIFNAQKHGDTDTVDTLITQLDNQILLGHVLANRYMSAGYESNADELSVWLSNYGDHPEAARIAALAARKGVDATHLAVISDTKPLKGDGYVFHLGRSTMPDGWYRGLRQWKEGQFDSAAQSFTAVGDNAKLNSWQRSAGSYWAYRSLLRSGDSSAASKQLASAASEPLTFYGQLALARQGKRMPVRAQAPTASTALRNDPQVMRASAFAALGMSDAAELELRSLYSKLDSSERPGLIAVASELNLANLQVRLARQPHLTEGEAMYGTYPTPDAVITASADIAPPALVLAVARHESGFRDQAYSGAGAVGMMQMLPSTAKAVLRHADLDLADAGDSMIPLATRLNDEVLSAKLGATYLKMLTQERAIGTSLMKILAGYNAGPGAVANWSKTARNMNDPLLYLESIPYPETHNYVVQVMAHYWIYQNMMGQRPASLEQLARGQWPTIS